MTRKVLNRKAEMLERRLRKTFKGLVLVKYISVSVTPVSDGSEVIFARTEFNDGTTVESIFGPAIGAYDLATEAKREVQKRLDEMVAEYLKKHDV